MKAGAQRPDISSIAAFKQALLDAPCVAYTGTGASGQYFANLGEKMGVGAEVKQKAKDPTAAKLMLDFMKKPQAQGIFRAKGMNTKYQSATL
jgi:molybdate transport system substrate-binding protein